MPSCVVLTQRRSEEESGMVNTVCLLYLGLTAGGITGRGPEVVTTLTLFDVRSMTQHRAP